MGIHDLRRWWLLAALASAFGFALAGDEPKAPPVIDRELPEAQLLQQPEAAFSVLPLDKRGKPDWVRALREKAIEPRAGLSAARPAEKPAPDVLMKNTAEMPYVKFPHEPHSQWLACSNCHDKPYAQKAGATSTTMTRIFLGESCGLCHGTVAFNPMFTCERCHSVPQPGQKPWW